MNRMSEQLVQYLDKYASNVSVQVPLQLPKLKKVDTTAPTQSLPKLQLPKLKKVEQ